MTCVKRLKRCCELADKKENRKDDWKDGRKDDWKDGRKGDWKEDRKDDWKATLSEKLILADRISELLKASTDREYRNKLLAEFGLA